MNGLPKLLVLSGIGLIILGVAVWMLSRTGLGDVLSRAVGSLGRLPGDIRNERENFRFYFPWVSCLVVSGVLTLLFQIVSLVIRGGKH